MTGLNLSGLKYNPDCLSYLSPKKKKIIFFSVLTAHFVFIVCPLIFTFFSDFVNPPIKGVAVTLVDIPYIIEGAPSKNPSKNNPTPSDDLPAPPDKLSDIPDVPDQEPEPEPEPAKEPVKPQPKEEKKPTDKVVVKEDSKPVAKETKKSSVLKPEDIKKSTKLVKGSSSGKSSTSTSTSKGKASEISKFLKEFGSSTTPGGGAGPKGDPNADDSYYSVIGAFLKSRWAKPSQNTLGGKLPEVLIELSIDASGKIINARIVSASGVNAMDMSVKALLRNLTEVPKPPRQMTFQVLMRIED